MRTFRVVLVGAVTSALLVGCGADGTSPSAEPGTPTSGASSSGTDDPGTTTGKASGGSKGSSAPSGSASPDPGTGDGDTTEAAGGDDTTEGATTDDHSTSLEDGGSGVEMPKEPEPSVNSLSELLGSAGSAPLVSVPLPRAASANGRLVAKFPTFLRPLRQSRVRTSSLSPSDSRLQATLVAATTLGPDDVLLAYRIRLGDRGLGELAAPAAAAGSVAAAFSRGRSVVTITATGGKAGTTYSVQATLHAAG